MKHILTLCIGNICRSPIAEALLKQQFPEKNVWSAGLGEDPQQVEQDLQGRCERDWHGVRRLAQKLAKQFGGLRRVPRVRQCQPEFRADMKAGSELTGRLDSVPFAPQQG